MENNSYENLEQFIYEYNSGRMASNENHARKFMGIEFLYKNIYYRMCREPLFEDKNSAFYQVSIMHCEKFGYPIADEFEILGNYKDIYDLLDNCIISGKSFKEVILDDKTKILSQD
jgi:hypothetical protein